MHRDGAMQKRARGRPVGSGEGEARAALLAAGRHEFGRRGYDGTTTRMLCERAGVSAPVLYHHYGSKAGLYAAVAKDINDEVLATIEHHMQGSTTLTERVGSILDAAIEVQAADRSLAEFTVRAPIDFGRHEKLAPMAPEMRRLRSYVELMVHEATPPPDLGSKDAVRVVLALIFGLSRMAATADPREYRKCVEAVRGVVRRAGL